MTRSEQFRMLAFAQLTRRESLRDIEATPSANGHKLYGMSLRQRYDSLPAPVSKPSLRPLCAYRHPFSILRLAASV